MVLPFQKSKNMVLVCADLCLQRCMPQYGRWHHGRDAKRGKDQVFLQKTWGQAESSYLFAMTVMRTHADRFALVFLRMVLPWLSDRIIIHYSCSSKFASSSLNLRNQAFIQNSNTVNSFQNYRLTQNSLQIYEILIIIPKTYITKMRGNISKFMWIFTELQIIKSV